MAFGSGFGGGFGAGFARPGAVTDPRIEHVRFPGLRWRMVNERSTAWLKVSFHTTKNQLAVPGAVSYRVDCLTTSANLRAWTTFARASSIEIKLDGEDNAILVDSHERERRCVTVVAAYGPDDADHVYAQFVYQVRNLRFVS